MGTAGGSPGRHAWHQFGGIAVVPEPVRKQVGIVADRDTKAYNTKMAETIASALRGAGLTGYDIQIRFQSGIATIGGTIADANQKAKVAQVVAAVAGVNSVDNGLLVAVPRIVAAQPAATMKPATVKASPGAKPTSKLANQRMAEAIAKALSAARLRSFDIEIRFRNGTAQVAGTVNSQQERAYAEQIVAGVPGVRKVENQLALGRRPAGLQQAAYLQPAAPTPGAAPGPPAAPAMPAPPSYGHPGGRASNVVYDMPNMPNYAWPSYAAHPNYAQVSYPKEYSASAWPYIGPFYPYPQIPMGWRQAQLEWDDGHWSLNFRPRTDKWWWFLNPENW